MTTQNRSKLKILLANLKSGTAILASWLKSKGISGDLQKHYIKSGWLEAIDRGVFFKKKLVISLIILEQFIHYKNKLIKKLRNKKNICNGQVMAFLLLSLLSFWFSI